MLLDPSPGPDTLTQFGTALVGLVVVLTPIANHFKGRKRDAGRKSEFETLSKKIDTNHKETTVQFQAIGREVFELKAHVIGPDGENGIRGDVRELKEDVKGILERERDRPLHEPYDRRRTG